MLTRLRSLAVAGCLLSFVSLCGCASVPGVSGLWGKSDEPSEALRVAYGKLQEAQGDTHSARKTFEAVLKDYPKSIDAMVGVARLDHMAGRTTEAEDRLKLARQHAPKNVSVMLGLGQLYMDTNRKDEALAALTDAAKLDRDDESVQYNMALALAQFGEPDAAVEQMAPVVGSAVAHYNVGWVLHSRGDLAGAERHMIAALRERPQLLKARQELQAIRGERDAIAANAAANLASQGITYAPVAGAQGAAAPGTQGIAAAQGNHRGVGAPGMHSGAGVSGIQPAVATGPADARNRGVVPASQQLSAP